MDQYEKAISDAGSGIVRASDKAKAHIESSIDRCQFIIANSKSEGEVRYYAKRLEAFKAVMNLLSDD